jgi:hypothetical protein
LSSRMTVIEAAMSPTIGAAVVASQANWPRGWCRC